MLGSSVNARVRPARAEDCEALAGVFAASWGDAYRCIIPSAHLGGLIRRRNAAWWATAVRNRESILVLEVADVIGGYATYGAARARGAFDGEIYELYLIPTFQGLGLGELLFEACRVKLDERGLSGLVVWALSANREAHAFYRRRGGRPMAKALDRVGGARLEKTGFGWP